MGGGKSGGLSLMTFWNSEKLSNFKAHELPLTVNELCTHMLRVPNSCPVIAHIYSWTLWKNHPSVVSNSKKKTNKKQKQKTQATRQRKLEISDYKIQL